MKIAFISDVIYPWVKGGAELRYFEIARRLAKKHEVHFFTQFYTGMSSKEFEYENIKVHCLNKAPQNLYVNGRRKILPALLFTLTLPFKLFRYRFDVVDSNEFPFFHNFIVFLFSKLKKSKFFITWLEVWHEYWHKYLGALGVFGFLSEFLNTKLPDEFITISEKTRRDLIDKWSVRKDKTTMIIPGINLTRIKKIKAKKDKNKIITVGRLIKEKNVDKIIRVMPKILEKRPEAKLIIVGEGPEKKNLEYLTKRLNIEKNVVFTGFLDDHYDLIKEIKSSRVYVSQSEREGFGITIIEALACGTAVVIPHNLSYFSYASYCTVTTDLTSSILNSTFKNNENIEEFDWDNVTKKVEMVYQKSIGE